MNLEREKIHLKDKIAQQNQEKIDQLHQEKEELEQHRDQIEKQDNQEELRKTQKHEKNISKKQIIFFLIFLIISIAIYCINQFTIKNIIISILNCLIIPIYLIWSIAQLTRKKNIEKKQEYEKKLKQQISEEKKKNEINILITKIESIQRQIEQLVQEQNEKKTRNKN